MRETTSGFVWRHVLVIVALFIALLGWTYGRWDLWGPDEGRYVQVAKELLGRENKLLLTVLGQPYTEKPPLPFWLMAAMLDLAGGRINVWWLRLPSILLSLSALLVVYGVGRQRFGVRAGFLAALFLMTAPQFVEQAPSARLDALLMGFVTLALAVWLLRPGWDRPLESPPLSWPRAAAFWALALAAFFVKGPTALLFILAPAAWEAFRLRSRRPWRSVRPLPGLLGLLAIVGAWLWAQRLAIGEESVEGQMVRGSVGRLFTTEHLEGPFYYLKGLFGEVFMPWTLLLVPGIMLVWKRRGSNSDGTALRPILGWILLPLIVLHLALGKRQHYLLPLVPALALVTGWYCDRAFLAVQARPRLARLVATFLVTLGCVAIVAAGIAWEQPERFWEQGIFIERPHVVMVAAAALVVVFAAALAFRRKTSFAILSALFAATYAIEWAELAAVNSAHDPGRSAKALAMQVEAALGPQRNAIAAIEKAASPRYHVYGDYQVSDISENAEDRIESGELADVLVLMAKDYQELNEEMAKAGYSRASTAWADNDKLVVAWRPEPRPTPEMATSGTLHIALLGDSGTGAYSEKHVVRQLDRLAHGSGLDAVFLLGDNIYGDMPYPAALDRRVVDPLEPLLGRRVPFFAALGNHDEQRRQYYQGELHDPIFRMEGREYYRQVIGNSQRTVSLFILNSETLPNDTAQLDWLAAALKDDRSDFRLLLLHRPLLGTAGRGGDGEVRAALAPLLSEGNRIDAVFAGHNHVFERLVDEQGVQHVTLGSAGKLARGARFRDDARRRAENSRQRVFGWLTLDGPRLSFTAYGADGRVLDSFEFPPRPLTEQTRSTSPAARQSHS